jgi:outer membrane beta-barrel protein
MRTFNRFRSLLLGASLALPFLAQAADTASAPELAITPEVQSTAQHPPAYASRDFEVGVVYGGHAIQYYGFSTSIGLRLAYHINEDFYVEGQYDNSDISDKRFWVKAPAGSSKKYLSKNDVPLRSTMVVMGYEGLIPGEVHLFGHYDYLTTGYLFGGVGRINFNDNNEKAFRLGVGTKLYLTNSIVIRTEAYTDFFTIDKPSPKLKVVRRKGVQDGASSIGISYIF